MKQLLLSIPACVALVVISSCTHVEMNLNVPTGGTLEDAILITSAGGAEPRQTFALGDIDLSIASQSFGHIVLTTSTHWWLIGHLGGNVVYTSNTALGGVDLYAVEPYDIPGANIWNIPANLDGYVNETAYSADWWAQTVNNHGSHVAPDANSASLWEFVPAGTDIGTIILDLRVP